MSAVRRQGRGAFLAVLVLSVVLVGCSKPVPTEAEIVGTWASHGTDGWGEPGGTMVFNADGTFTAYSVPKGLLMVGVREATPIDGEGTWSIDDGSFGNSPNYYSPGIQIVHSPDTPGTHHLRFDFDSNRGGLSLTYWNDYDSGERYILVKED